MASKQSRSTPSAWQLTARRLQGVGVVWKGFETYSQFSLRNKALVAIDWLRTKVFGRDISRV